MDLAATAPSPCHAPFVAAVGGSFAFHVGFLLARLPCQPRVVLYHYFHVERATFAPFARGPVDPAQRDADLLQAADVVLLEENEDRVFRSTQATELWRLLEGSIEPR